MSETFSRIVLAAQRLDRVAFAPYGEVIQARRGTANQFHGNPYDPESGSDEAKLVLDNGTPRLWIMHLPERGLRFSNLARHCRVTQCLGALGGREWFLGVAPPSDDRSDAGRPDLARLAAFRIPGDCVVKLHVACWHAGPHFLGDEALFFNLENLDTNKRDFHQVPLPAEYEIQA
jgi:ureidoglycolate hydrolase